jgi:hypothetical protein
MPVKKNDFLSKLSAPARRALEGKGLTSLKKIAACTTKELLTLHGVGPSTIPILKEALQQEGLDFKTEAVSPKKTK